MNRDQPSLKGLESPRELIEDRHYRKTWPSGKSQIYTFEDTIVVFSIPANPYINRWMGCQVWEFSRLWAPDGHRPNLLTQAISYAVKRFSRLNLSDVLISYADPNQGHHGGIYRAASWQYLGQSEESRGWQSPDGQFHPRRKFHSSSSHINKAEIEALGFKAVRLKGKLRFAKGITKLGRKAIERKVAELRKAAE